MEKKNKLWTRDFTIITIGTVVSMFGNSLAGFALGLLVLDYTGSTFLYALYLFLYTFPKIVAPILAGPYLDKFSRKKTIYTLDFIISAIFVVFAASIQFGWFSFTILIVGAFLMGAIDSIYQVAYSSLYPMLITEGNYQKAYSITSVLETVTVLMVPISAFVYNTIGIAPLLFINAGTFFVAAVMETQIKHVEEYSEVRKNEEYGMKKYFGDFKEGLQYLMKDKGLLAICLYFAFISFSGGVESVLQLPYFKGNYEGGEYVYMGVMVGAVIGRFLGGLTYYKFSIPTKRKYTISLIAYIAMYVISAVYLFTPTTVMFGCMFVSGLLGVTTYNIRISATQSYVPHERKGRFNGTFQMMCTCGMLLGEMVGGGLSLVANERIVMAGTSVCCALAAVILIGGNKKHVSKIYNRDA